MFANEVRRYLTVNILMTFLKVDKFATGLYRANFARTWKFRFNLFRKINYWMNLFRPKKADFLKAFYSYFSSWK